MVRGGGSEGARVPGAVRGASLACMLANVCIANGTSAVSGVGAVRFNNAMSGSWNP